MDKFWVNFAFEIGFFSLLGVIFYFYQKRKIIHYEENKAPLVMNYIMQACLGDKLDRAQPELDKLIEALDDYLNHKSTNPPISMLKKFAEGQDCSPELKEAILEGIKELNQ